MSVPVIMQDRGHGLVLVSKEYEGAYSLKHHGVKGQKHGIRRWQNEDGSYTSQGYQHYAEMYGWNKKSWRKEADIKKYIKDDGKLNDSGLSKYTYQTSATGQRRMSLVGRMKFGNKYSKDFNENSSKDTVKTLKKELKDIGFDDDSIAKMDNKTLEKTWWNNVSDKTPTSKEVEEFVNASQDSLNLYSRKEKDKQRQDKAATIGLKALKEMGDIDINDNDINDKAFKDWFLYEDQTIGLAVIADMINRGYDSKKVVEIIKTADRTIADLHDDGKLESFAFELAENAHDGGRAKLFAESCEKIINEEKRDKSDSLNKKD